MTDLEFDTEEWEPAQGDHPRLRWPWQQAYATTPLLGLAAAALTALIGGLLGREVEWAPVLLGVFVLTPILRWLHDLGPRQSARQLLQVPRAAVVLALLAAELAAEIAEALAGASAFRLRQLIQRVSWGQKLPNPRDNAELGSFRGSR